jgi:oligoendopeptidase F
VTGASSDSPDASGVAWNLDALMPGGAAGASAAGRGALSLAEAFARAHRTRIAGYDAERLRAVLEELERLQETLSAASAFAEFRFDADTEPPEHGALMSEMEETAAAVETLTTFFDLEWIATDDVRAAELLDDPALERYAHMLRVLRLSKPHRLTEPEEQILTQKAVTGVEAWRRLLEEQISSIQIDLDGDQLALPEAIARMSSDDRQLRRRAAGAISAALEPGLRTRTQTFNVILADHALDDRLRHFPHWLAELNLENEASDESVKALVDAVVARYDIPQRWYRIKARALGLDRMADYDRPAPVAGPPPRISWARARELVVASYSGFSEELGVLAERFFTERWIDAEPRAGKIPGAYCAPTVPDANPYVLVNFAGRNEDVLALAHEIGHGLHFLLAAPRGLLQMSAPVTVSETASVFGETLMFAHLLALAEDPAARFGLLAQQLDDAVGTVFRQVAIHRFEDAVHRERREHGELSAERIGEHWVQANAEMFGDSVEITGGYRSWWSHISHVFSTPGYVYGYAYGQLLALSIYARYLEQGDDFVPSYLELLSAGGSRPPEELAQIVGVDLTDPDFWDTGLGLIDRRLEETEAASAAVAR